MSSATVPHPSVLERYQPKPFPGSSHSWALAQASAWSRTGPVLDVGVGSGILGQSLKELGFSAVYGIEPDSAAAAAARGWYQDIAPSLDLIKVDGFKAVVLLDVLEHMAQPEEFMRQLTARCAPGCEFLISVPNIAHWAIRLMLLCGYFDYHDRGPLDRTHMRFFTLRSLRKLVKGNPELSIISETASVVPLELMLPQWMIRNPVFEVTRSVRMHFAQLLPGLCGYQLLCKVVKRG